MTLQESVTVHCNWVRFKCCFTVAGAQRPPEPLFIVFPDHATKP